MYKKKDIKKKKISPEYCILNPNMAVITNQCDNVGRPVTHPQREEQGAAIIFMVPVSELSLPQSVNYDDGLHEVD